MNGDPLHVLVAIVATTGSRGTTVVDVSGVGVEIGAMTVGIGVVLVEIDGVISHILLRAGANRVCHRVLDAMIGVMSVGGPDISRVTVPRPGVTIATNMDTRPVTASLVVGVAEAVIGLVSVEEGVIGHLHQR